MPWHVKHADIHFKFDLKQEQWLLLQPDLHPHEISLSSPSEAIGQMKAVGTYLLFPSFQPSVEGSNDFGVSNI